MVLEEESEFVHKGNKPYRVFSHDVTAAMLEF